MSASSRVRWSVAVAAVLLRLHLFLNEPWHLHQHTCRGNEGQLERKREASEQKDVEKEKERQASPPMLSQVADALFNSFRLEGRAVYIFLSWLLLFRKDHKRRLMKNQKARSAIGPARLYYTKNDV